MTARRIRLAVVLLVLAASGLALLAWSQVWISADALQPGTTPKTLEVTGSTAAPALTALALAGVALAGALTIAGPVIRIALGLLEMLLGFSVGLAAVLALSDPAGASAALITASTGIAGRESVTDGVVASVSTPWPYAALVSGVLMALAGIAILATIRRWPGHGARYQAVRFEATDAAVGTPGSAPDPVDDWDGLTRGEDPTTLR